MGKYLFSLFFLISICISQGQEITLQGKLTDTLLSPLENANILAIPSNKGNTIAFSISDGNGNYKLSLKKDNPYALEISYLGYQKISVLINLKENTKRDFRLVASNESLDEIILKQKLAVSVKKDTITYQTDVFATGEERKLREVLKKLPGVEVDREGNVKVNGKKVDKFLVEGKPFFTGDTKLGVNNIPADVVAEVEVLDNYNEVAFLKDLSDSDVLAMNIKLKEGKKKFVFGDMEAGGGIENRYLLHPSLFYYSPKTNINFIGDLNNTGEKSFTFSDYLNFEGGFAKLLDNPTGYQNLLNSDFAKYLTNNDFVYNRNTFGAFSLSQQLSLKTTVTAYSIVNASKTDTKVENTNTYLTDNTVTDIENRLTITTADNLFTLSKVSAKYIPNFDEDLTYDLVVKSTSGNANERLESISFLDSNFVASKLEPTSFEVNQNLAYSKQFSYKHTTTLNANLNISSNDNRINWQFSDPIFNEIVPLLGESPFVVSQNIDSKNYNGSLAIKHYWVFNNFNHIYPIVGYNFSKQKYNTIDQELLENGTNSFGSFGFNNKTEFQLNDSYIGFQYKAKAGDFIFKPGLVYHYYYWSVLQFSNPEVSKSKNQLLPEMKIDWELKSSEKMNFKYSLDSRFNDVSFFANRLRLQGFNSLYKGNSNIENELAHRASLSYYKFSLLRGLFMNASINYSKKVKTVQNAIIIDGIDQINTAFYSDLPENRFAMNASFSKKIKKIKYTIAGNASFSEYSRNVNNVITDYQSNNYNYTIKAETYFKEFPNIEIGVQQGFSDFSSASSENKFIQTDPYANLEYDFLKGFILKVDYTYSHYRNKANNSENSFQLGNTSLFYNKEDSPWGFEIEANNLFDIKFKNQNSFNQYIINDTQIFIQPRTVLFKLSYKL